MRRLTSIIIAAFLACHSAGAQNLDGLLKMFGLDSAEPDEQKTEVRQTPALTAEALRGVWHYAEPAARYDGDDMLGSIGFKALEPMLPSMYAKAGLSAGNGAMKFMRPDVVSGEIGEYRIAGRYGFTPADGAIVLSVTIREMECVMHGTAAFDGEFLTLLFDAAEAAATVERVSPKAARNDNFKLLKSLLDKYPGVKLGCRMKR